MTVGRGLAPRTLFLIATGWITLTALAGYVPAVDAQSPHPVPAAAIAAPTAAPAATTPLAYDVATIKPHDPSDRSMLTNNPPDGYTATNVGLKTLIQFVYNLQSLDLISGLPGWANSASFDVQAKMDEDVMATLNKLPKKEQWAQRQAMMLALLADRFQLKVHHETKDLPIYSLSIAKGGSKLKPADPNDPRGNSMSYGNGQLTLQAAPLENLVDFLSWTLHRKVVDNTGLSGNYDTTLRWSSDEVASTPQDPAANSAPSLFTALQEQLGLKLESTKGPVDTIVVDHVEKPSEN
jgi:uncharacterized protein (TIGR03435 family)